MHTIPVTWCMVVAILGVCLIGCKREVAPKTAAPPPPPPRVLFVTPTEQMVTEYEEFTGRTAATEAIELRARVSGYLDKIFFTDGQEVKKGNLLFKVDDRLFVAEEKRTSAAMTQYQLRIKKLQNQVARAEQLFKQKALSQDEFENLTLELQEAQATLEALTATNEVAKLNLQFTEVKAPIDGRIGKRLIDEKNLVTADQTPLAMIVPTDHVHVYFDMDERTVLKLRRLESQGVLESANTKHVTVDISLADSDIFTLQGVVDFQDNQIDSATGTLRTRATVDNAKGLLLPGLFVRLRYPIGKESTAILVPEESLASDQGRPFVFVINAENKVEARNVELGPQVGGLRVIRQGLKSADRIAVTGLQRLRRNSEVTPEERKTVEKTVEKTAEASADHKLK